MEAKKQEIANNISKGKTFEALELARNHFPKFANQVVILQGKFSRLDSRFHAGALNLEKYNEGVAGISFDLINMMSGEDKQTKSGMSNLPVLRLITFQTDFLKGVISEFLRSKIILFTSLVFIVVVGCSTVYMIGDVMPTFWGKVFLSVTLFAFLSLVVSSLGFINVQIKQFNSSKSFLKFQEYREQDS
jgi:hypothetical protein